MTPAELNAELTALLHSLLSDTGFSKKRKCTLRRKINECEQIFYFSFTRDRGIPGNIYSLGATMSFSFPEVDKLTSRFMGDEYDATWATGVKPFYLVVPNSHFFSYKYSLGEPLDKFAQKLSDDFHAYALSFYESYDTLSKLENHFNQNPDNINLPNGFRIVRSNQHGNGCWCCKAAVLCVLEKWDKVKQYIDETDLLLPEQKARISEYITNR